MSYLGKIVKLTNEFCDVLTDMERAGIPIDIQALDKLEKETQERCDLLEISMRLMADEVMGDTPVNFSSPDQLSTLLFSRQLKNKAEWKQQLGLYPNQNKFEVLMIKKKLPVSTFVRMVQAHTEVIYRTQKQLCAGCNGTGKYKKTGERLYKCKSCDGKGVEYVPTDKVGGFKISPIKDYISSSGFQSSTDVIEHLLENAKLSQRARKFITMLSEYRQLKSYLATNIQGIRNGMVRGVLHTNFNQTVTKTGRLSSTNPNVQNFPRGDTFPIKRVFISRWKDGVIVDGDMGQLEFRCAAHQAKDTKAIADILAGVDIHAATAEKLGVTRQEAKAFTFKPLYGGKDWGLLERYPLIKKWHERLITEAVTTKQIVLETGRVYFFPGTKRTANGCTNQTKIKNYPVQGFASADVVPSIIIELHNKLKGSQSYITSTIHDSIIVDVHPEEVDKVLPIVYTVMNDGAAIIKRRFGIDMLVPFKADVKIGKNAFDTELYTGFDND